MKDLTPRTIGAPPSPHGEECEVISRLTPHTIGAFHSPRGEGWPKDGVRS